MVNKVILMGNVGKEPEIRVGQNGTKMAHISIATTEVTGKKDAREERTEWHRVIMFGNNAEVAEKYVKKGDRLFVEGKIRTRKWTDKQGQERYVTEIMADTMVLPVKSVEEKREPVPTTSYSAPKKISNDEPFDEGIPF